MVSLFSTMTSVGIVRSAGATSIELIAPDEGARRAFGLNMMDARRNQPAAENGLRLGRELAARVAKTWNA